MIDAVSAGMTSAVPVHDEPYAVGGTTPPAGGTQAPASTGSTSSASSSAATSVYGLGKDDFFKLFLAQLQNQDPTSPMDDTQMVSQLAQFSMIEMLQQLTSAMQGSQLAQASALIGQTVTGTDTGGNELTGLVSGVEQTSNGLVLMLGSQSMAADQVTSVGSAATSSTAASGGTGQQG